MIPEPPPSPLLEIGSQEFAQWMHSPITKGVFQFVDDTIALWRENAADLLEAGAFRLNDPHEDRNPDVVRGKLIALRTLRGITLEEIQGFYGQSAPEQSQEAKPDE